MKNKTSVLFLLLVTALFMVSCDEDDYPDLTNPFDNCAESSHVAREKIVVISDLHLGNDLTYSENVKHLERLEQFLNEVRESESIKELILAGDILDEWYIPTRIDSYGAGTQADFARKSATANKAVFDALNGIIKDGKIILTYIPGNHDMGFSPEHIDMVLPGVNQARDKGEKYPVGTYYPDGYPQIAIEHGHRYDFFNAIAPGANESEAPGAIMPPGYFFARIAANSFTNPTTKQASTKVSAITLNDPDNAEQYSKSVYYNLWKSVLEDLIYVDDNFNDPIITTKVGKHTKTYAINDILPKNSATDGTLQMRLYNNLFTQASWDARQKYNNVEVMNEINSSIWGGINTEFFDQQADKQYFKNPNSNVRLVVFGHTHGPKIRAYSNLKNETCLYVNSGTWEDKKTRDKTAAIDQDALNMDFVVIEPVESDKKLLLVSLYQYKRGVHTLKDIDLLPL